jgi:enoyl-[acyl-carrier protein] reductase I
MGFLSGKKALIVGLATDRSIAWGISQSMRREGAELAFSYQNDRIKDRVVELAGELGSSLVMPMDVGIDAEIDAAFTRIRAEWSSLDILVHSVAFAPREALTGGFV